jgi:hypothetical protein
VHRVVACAVVTAVLCLASGAAAGLVPRSPRVTDAGSLTVTPNHVRAGAMVRLRGRAAGCPAGDTVSLISRAFSRVHEFASVPAVLTRVRPDGSFTTTTRIPRTRRPARYGITGRCGGGNLGFDVWLTVLR